MSELLKINVNDHTEKKNGLTYLSWAWAWAEVLKVDPRATWEAHEFQTQGSEHGATVSPCMLLRDGTAMVKVSVTIKGDRKTCLLPVMNHRNQAIKNPDAFAINTAVMRCLAKAISMHGLGLYIYAGEDLPEGDDKDSLVPVLEASLEHVKKQAPGIKPTDGAMDSLDEEEQSYIRSFAMKVDKACKDGAISLAVDKIAEQGFDNIQIVALWSCLDSKARSAIKAEQKRRTDAANQSNVKETA